MPWLSKYEVLVRSRMRPVAVLGMLPRMSSRISRALERSTSPSRDATTTSPFRMTRTAASGSITIARRCRSLGGPLPERMAERGGRGGKRHQFEVKSPRVQRGRRDGEKRGVVDGSVLTENLVEQMSEEVVEIRRRTAGDRPLKPRQSGLGSLRAGFDDSIGIQQHNRLGDEIELVLIVRAR